MDLEKIIELMQAMESQGMSKIVIKKKDGFELELERGSGAQVVSYPSSTQTMIAPSQVDQKINADVEKMPEKVEAAPGFEVTSPMVGTFYSSPSPDDEPFVKAGDTVSEDTIVCIIEAMKVMNEVKAGKSGVVKEVLLEDSDPVEFGTKLLTIS